MTKIGIVCGDGNLPLYIGNVLEKKNFKIKYLLLNNIQNKNIYKNLDFANIEIISLKKLIGILNQNKIQKIIFAGSIKRPSISEIGFDFETIKIAKDLLLEKKGDNSLLISIQNYFKNKGFKFFDWTKYCQEIFSNENNLTKFKPSKSATKNFEKAKSVYKNFKNLDVGQSIIIQNELVLGIEAIEGTDNLIKRCSEYKRKGDKGILLKFSKKNQSKLIDIPLIGLDTIKNIHKYGYEGIFLERKNCLIINKLEVIEYANKNKLFISCMDLN